MAGDMDISSLINTFGPQILGTMSKPPRGYQQNYQPPDNGVMTPTSELANIAGGGRQHHEDEFTDVILPALFKIGGTAAGAALSGGNPAGAAAGGAVGNMLGEAEKKAAY